jgi:uncharacterized glyoxalase superfamily protein PhnB
VHADDTEEEEDITELGKILNVDANDRTKPWFHRLVNSGSRGRRRKQQDQGHPACNVTDTRSIQGK